MAKPNALYTGASEPETVDAFMAELDHPMADVAAALRKIILSVDKNIGEGIFWNAPTFYYTGKMKDFDPKTYKRYLAGFVFNKKDCIRMVFLRGAELKDKSGLLQGDFQDGRRLAVFSSLNDVNEKEKVLKDCIKQLLKTVDN